MALNRIPYFTLSTAKLRVIVKTPDLAIAEDTINPEPVEAVFTILSTVSACFC
jgi:hypothetical protein